MLQRIELAAFKCFEVLDIELRSLTLLAGVNAAGKSTVIQSLLLLHQALADGGAQGVRRTNLPLGGPLVTLGTIKDVVNQDVGGSRFSIGVTDGTGFRITWSLTGTDRAQPFADVAKVQWSPNGTASGELLPPSAQKAGRDLLAELIDIQYVPADRVGPADVYPLVEPARHATLGPRAERALGRLFWRGSDLVDEAMRHPDPSYIPTLLAQVEGWMRDLFPGVRIQVTPLPDTNLVTLGVRTQDSTSFHRSHNVGFGIAYVLPLVIALLTARDRGLVVLENPEAHLHPRAQIQIARLIVRHVQRGGQVLIETHSDHILNAVRVAIASQHLRSEQTAVHWFEPDPESGAITPRMVAIDERGRLGERPDGFFDEVERQLVSLMGE